VIRPTLIAVLLMVMAAVAAPVAAPAAAAAAGDDASRGIEFSPGDDLARVADLLTGSFSSAAQAAADSDYFDIRLEMARIWPERGDAIWLYVEQARADRLDRPYRQRVYRLSDGPDGTVVSEVLTLPAPLRFAGAWRQDAPLASLAPDSLTAREGCAIFLRRQPDGSFAGSTLGRGCASDLRGAAYATSEVVVTDERMVSWDRGFDADGKQVWGAEKGGYEFVRTGGRR